MKRARRLGAGVLGSTVCLAFGVGCVGSHRINSRRQRFFSDSFFLTPETLRLPYKEVSFKTADGVTLKGWYIEQTVRGRLSKRCVMCCNPYNYDKSNLLGVARGLWDNGYSVFLFDFRSHAPEPTDQSIGYLEERDAHAALNWLCENKPTDAKIGLVGASMGGAMALTVAAESRPEVVAAATDCAFNCLKDIIGVRLDSMFPTTRLFGLDSFVPLHRLFLESTCLINKIVYGYDPAKVGPKRLLDRIQIPVLVCHSEMDTIVPMEQGKQIYEGIDSKEKQFFVIKGTEHIGGYFCDEKEYVSRQVDFFNQCFERVEKKENEWVEQRDALEQEGVVNLASQEAAK